MRKINSTSLYPNALESATRILFFHSTLSRAISLLDHKSSSLLSVPRPIFFSFFWPSSFFLLEYCNLQPISYSHLCIVFIAHDQTISDAFPSSCHLLVLPTSCDESIYNVCHMCPKRWNLFVIFFCFVCKRGAELFSF